MPGDAVPPLERRFFMTLVGIVVAVTGFLAVQVVIGGNARDVAIASLAATLEATVKDVDENSGAIEHLRRLYETSSR